ncbi:MAG: [FeFe] hydrogenase H-cluster radical SAM maturase HydE [Fibrobacterota bacterium]
MNNIILARAAAGERLSAAEIADILADTDPATAKELFSAAYAVKAENVGTVAYFRGIIECSNICTKDCYYCGIRKGNRQVERYSMDPEDIYREALQADQFNYGSIVIQAGERQDPAFIAMIENILRRIKEATEGRIGITLSLGEQSRETYRRWFEAGAHRYLLRIETSDPDLYAQLHPADHSYEARVQALRDLRDTGYQVGTGFMMGLPGQTYRQMARDILFLDELDIDMVGMGPYIPHGNTPLGRDLPPLSDAEKRRLLNLGLRMIAMARLTLRDVNIAATTALQALAQDGREQGLQAGANVIMPNLTETVYRPNYSLYENKPCTDENAGMCRGCLQRRIESIGETIGYNQWGDSPHFHRRTL